MKKILSIITLFFIMYSCLFVAISKAENDRLCEKFVRVHIIADSNSDYDQAIKLKVRDYLFSIYKEELKGFDKKQETIDFIRENSSNIKLEIDKFLFDSGCDYSSNVELAIEKFPSKAYGNIMLPKGVYDAIKITLGKGNGKNFFCVMFPPMCVDSNVISYEPLENNLTEKEKEILSSKIRYKSKILETITKITF